MNIIFFGSGAIAVASLSALLQNKYNVVCVVTAIDKQKGRGLPVTCTPIKDFAVKKALNIFQPDNPSSNNSLDYLKGFSPDLFVVFSYGKILSKELLNIPKCLPVNIHASLLPKYRGAAPINWVLINGEKETGVSIIRMNEKIDEGEIILKEKIEITETDTFLTLERKISELAAKLIIESIEDIKNNKSSFKKQKHANATYAPKLKKEDGKIDWNKSAHLIKNQIRGCLPWPGSFAIHNNNPIKIWAAEVAKIKLKKDCRPGTIISFDKEGILVATKGGGLLIKELQLPSGKRLNAWQFIQGHKMTEGELFL